MSGPPPAKMEAQARLRSTLGREGGGAPRAPSKSAALSGCHPSQLVPSESAAFRGAIRAGRLPWRHPSRPPSLAPSESAASPSAIRVGCLHGRHARVSRPFQAPSESAGAIQAGLIPHCQRLPVQKFRTGCGRGCIVCGISESDFASEHRIRRYSRWSGARTGSAAAERRAHGVGGGA